MSGTLYIIGTPIGNLEDITMRQLRLLGEVDFIAAEDTRVTRKLLSHFDIHTPALSYHEHSGRTSPRTSSAGCLPANPAVWSRMQACPVSLIPANRWCSCAMNRAFRWRSCPAQAP